MKIKVMYLAGLTNDEQKNKIPAPVKSFCIVEITRYNDPVELFEEAYSVSFEESEEHDVNVIFLNRKDAKEFVADTLRIPRKFSKK